MRLPPKSLLIPAALALLAVAVLPGSASAGPTATAARSCGSLPSRHIAGLSIVVTGAAFTGRRFPSVSCVNAAIVAKRWNDAGNCQRSIARGQPCTVRGINGTRFRCSSDAAAGHIDVSCRQINRSTAKILIRFADVLVQ